RLGRAFVGVRQARASYPVHPGGTIVAGPHVGIVLAAAGSPRAAAAAKADQADAEQRRHLEVAGLRRREVDEAALGGALAIAAVVLAAVVIAVVRGAHVIARPAGALVVEDTFGAGGGMAERDQVDAGRGLV